MSPSPSFRYAVGGDHAGFGLKHDVVALLREQGLP